MVFTANPRKERPAPPSPGGAEAVAMLPADAPANIRTAGIDPWLSRRLADLLDRAFPVRGSSARFGLDPLIGLIPGIGDAISAGLGSIIVMQAVRLNAPRPLVLRMTANLAVNAVVGAIPVLGDIFSFLFRSNLRNYALLRAWHSGEKSYPQHIPPYWLAAGCMGLIVAAAAVGALLIWVVSALWKALSG
jgi:hypothetical protein